MINLLFVRKINFIYPGSLNGMRELIINILHLDETT
jgi:hypothetical protein